MGYQGKNETGKKNFGRSIKRIIKKIKKKCIHVCIFMQKANNKQRVLWLKQKKKKLSKSKIIWLKAVRKRKTRKF